MITWWGWYNGSTTMFEDISMTPFQNITCSLFTRKVMLSPDPASVESTAFMFLCIWICSCRIFRKPQGGSAQLQGASARRWDVLDLCHSKAYIAVIGVASCDFHSRWLSPTYFLAINNKPRRSIAHHLSNWVCPVVILRGLIFNQQFGTVALFELVNWMIDRLMMSLNLERQLRPWETPKEQWPKI